MLIGGRRGPFAFSEPATTFEIVAPIKDFDTRNMIIENGELKNKVEIPDPIVLQPVYHNNEKHYLIVTAWGIEAEDELVKKD
jgi:hypothetical protein